MTTQVSRDEVLAMRRELFAQIPDKIRIRLADMDYLLGWPPDGELERIRTAILGHVEFLEKTGGLTSTASANFRYLLGSAK